MKGGSLNIRPRYRTLTILFCLESPCGALRASEGMAEGFVMIAAGPSRRGVLGFGCREHLRSVDVPYSRPFSSRPALNSRP